MGTPRFWLPKPVLALTLLTLLFLEAGMVTSSSDRGLASLFGCCASLTSGGRWYHPRHYSREIIKTPSGIEVVWGDNTYEKRLAEPGVIEIGHVFVSPRRGAAGIIGPIVSWAGYDVRIDLAEPPATSDTAESLFPAVAAAVKAEGWYSPPALRLIALGGGREFSFDWRWLIHDLLVAPIWLLALGGLISRWQQGPPPTARERALARGECTVCGYPLVGLPRCPECGHTAHVPE